jgi:hypothetical protein
MAVLSQAVEVITGKAGGFGAISKADSPTGLPLQETPADVPRRLV